MAVIAGQPWAVLEPGGTVLWATPACPAISRKSAASKPRSAAPNATIGLPAGLTPMDIRASRAGLTPLSGPPRLGNENTRDRPARPARCHHSSFGRIFCLPCRLRPASLRSAAPLTRAGSRCLKAPSAGTKAHDVTACHGRSWGVAAKGGIPMGIAHRIAELYAAKMNAVLDRVSDPRELADYSYVELQDLLAEVHRGVAQVAAGRERAERRVSELRHAADRLRSRPNGRSRPVRKAWPGLRWPAVPRSWRRFRPCVSSTLRCLPRSGSCRRPSGGYGRRSRSSARARK